MIRRCATPLLRIAARESTRSGAGGYWISHGAVERIEMRRLTISSRCTVQPASSCASSRGSGSLGRRHRVDPRLQRHAPSQRAALERGADSLQLSGAVCDDVEANRAVRVLRTRGEPRCGGAPEPAHLLHVDHLEWIAEALAGLAFHLTEHERRTAPHDEVELVAADPDVLTEDAVRPQAVMPTRFELGRVPQARRPRGRPSRATSGGGSATGRARGRSSCATA